MRVWHIHQTALLAAMKARRQKAVLGGDARCDSPGHSAKYSTYTMMDLETNKVISLHLTHVIEDIYYLGKPPSI